MPRIACRCAGVLSSIVNCNEVTFQALNDNVAHIVMIDPDQLHLATTRYNLKPLFYETTFDSDKYLTVALVRASSPISTFGDLMGRSACFPVYDGVAWNSVAHVLQEFNLATKCPPEAGLAEFFGPSCTPGLPKGLPKHMNTACGNQEMYKGEDGALRCLIHERGDVAFVSYNSLVRFLKDAEKNSHKLKISDFRVLKPDNSKAAHLSWAPLGVAMIRADSTDFWVKDTFDVFLQMDALFGMNYSFVTPPFTMYGKFDGASNVLFHDKTVALRSVPTFKNADTMSRPYSVILESIEVCNGSSNINSALVVYVSALLMLLKLFF